MPASRVRLSNVVCARLVEGITTVIFRISGMNLSLAADRFSAGGRGERRICGPG